MDDQAILSHPHGEVDEAIRALEAVGVSIACPFNLAAHVLAAMVSHRFVLAALRPTRVSSLVPTVPVGMPSWTLRVRMAADPDDAERRRRHSHAEHGNEGKRNAVLQIM